MPKTLGNLERWHELARQLPHSMFTFPVPLQDMFAEAESLARFVNRRWNHTPELPGLEQLGPEILTRGVSQELLELQRAAMLSHETYLFLVGQTDTAVLMDQGRSLLHTLTAAIEFVLDDGRDDYSSRQNMCALDACEDDPYTMEMIAAALDDYANVAETLNTALKKVPGFNTKVIDQAYETVRQMRCLPVGVARNAKLAQQSLSLRNRLLQLLDQRARLVRRAARFTFRSHPEILAEVVRTYHRRWRAAARRREMSERTAEFVAVWPEDLT